MLINKHKGNLYIFFSSVIALICIYLIVIPVMHVNQSGFGAFLVVLAEIALLFLT